MADDGQKTAKKPEPVTLTVDGKSRVFDIYDPELPKWVYEDTLETGGYPYGKKLKKDLYKETLEPLQVELVKMQSWLKETGERVMVLFEGRDAAGKGGTISVVHEYMNPRTARNVALSKPTETEAGQWYYQRYIAHFPTASEFVSFDRSWYNRGGVEPVMGFCTPEQHERFLEETPHFEERIVRDGIRLFKIWLSISQEIQLQRFHDRVHSKLKHWKFSPIDVAGMKLWDAYTQARETMIARTHTEHAPWTIVRSNDKRRARIEVIRHLLAAIPYAGKDKNVIGKADPLIIGSGPDFLDAAEKSK